MHIHWEFMSVLVACWGLIVRIKSYVQHIYCKNCINKCAVFKEILSETVVINSIMLLLNK